MRTWPSILFAATLAAIAAPSHASPVKVATARAVGLEADIGAVAKAGAGSAGAVGVAAWRLDGQGPVVLVNGDSVFPMASTFKVAVAGKVLDRIDRGEVRLDQMISISPDRLIDSDIIASRFIHPGLTVSVYNLLELMLTESDNTATDYLVDVAGGPEAVTAWVRTQGVEGFRVDGGTDEIIRRFFNLGPGAFPAVYAARAKADPHLDEEGERPSAVFDADPRDTTSPRQMAQLLTRIFNGQALSHDSTRLMIAIMERCRTGVARLRAMLPPGAVAADKTGTIGGTVNDVGVITLPQGAGRVVVAVFIKASDAPMDAREKTIAQIGRAVRDYYLYQARP